MKFKALFSFFIALISLGLILAGAAFLWASNNFQGPGPLKDVRLVNIQKGSGLNSIAATLEREGAIEHPFVFILGTRLMSAQSDLKAGEYELEPGMSPRAIMEKLRDGDAFARRITVPEGKTSYEIIQILNANPDLTGDVTLCRYCGDGFVLPGTYDYQLGERRQDVFERMATEMSKLILELCEPYMSEDDKMAQFQIKTCGNPPLRDILDVLTLASIIEKETGVPEERRTIAGVFINRLKAGIPLQTDPTVIYAINKGANKNDGKGPLGRRLLSKDLAIDSPYNTYKYAGLPPGPIANPGKESIEAALNPEVNDYIYFVADGTGGHVFSKTLAEHNANVAKWRKIRKERQ